MDRETVDLILLICLAVFFLAGSIKYQRRGFKIISQPGNTVVISHKRGNEVFFATYSKLYGWAAFLLSILVQVVTLVALINFGLDAMSVSTLW